VDKTLRTYGIDLSPEQEELIIGHLQFVLEKNKELNLTHIREPERALLLHVVDSLFVLPEVRQAPEGALLDMGSGAGYPGLPLAVVTQRNCTLLDAREKKVRVLQEFLQAHPALSYCEAVAGRAEEFALEHRGSFAIVIVRALAALPSLLELASPLLQQGGQLITLKGRLDQEEHKRAEQLREATGLCEYSHRAYTLPGGEHREVIVYEKMVPAQRDLPRRSGRAQRKPLA